MCKNIINFSVGWPYNKNEKECLNKRLFTRRKSTINYFIICAYKFFYFTKFFSNEKATILMLLEQNIDSQN